MRNPIHLDMSIAEMIENYPETRELFLQHGFDLFANDEVVRRLGTMLKLKTVLRSRQMNPETFLTLLHEKIREAENWQRLTGCRRENGGAVNLLSLLPCPLMVPLQSELTSFSERLRQERGLELNYCIEAFFTQHVNFEDYLQCYETVDEIPDVLMTAGYSFCYSAFRERFLQKGVFADLPQRPVHSELERAGLLDPEGCVSVIAVNTLVMVVDHRRLAGRAAPSSWDDLLRPEYRRQVVVRGHDGYFCDIVQMNYYKDHGEDGVARLGQAVRCGLHPAQMVKDLRREQEEGPSVYVMPYFFAKTLPERPELQVVWPREGALAYPVSVLVKAEKLEPLKELAEFLTGPRVAAICSGAYFPALHPAAPLPSPSGAAFKWLGWDYIRNRDMEKILERVSEVFLQAHREGGEEG